MESLRADTFTFVGYGNSQSRWLDHVVGRKCDDASINNMRVLVDVNGSDHLPLQFDLELKNLTYDENQNISLETNSQNLLIGRNLKRENKK